MKKAFLLFIVVIFSVFSRARAQDNCEKELLKLIVAVESNYPGFAEKTKNKVAYNYIKDDLIKRSSSCKSDGCLALLKEYLTFFRDGHLFIVDNSSYLQRVKMDKKETIKPGNNWYKKITLSKDSLEGIWKNESFRVGIIKTERNAYKALIISARDPHWKPNDVLFSLNPNYIGNYHSSDTSYYKDTYSLKDPKTLFFNKTRHYFFKDNENTLDSIDLENRVNKLLGLYIEKLTPRTTLIKLEKFDYPFVGKIEKLIKDNRQLLESSENLIIDLRDNGGGTTDAFAPLLPYIMTGKTRSMNVEHLITDFLISGIQNYAKGLPDDDVHKSQKSELNKKLIYYKENLGKFVLDPTQGRVEVNSFNQSRKNPTKVVFLVNNKVGSSAEALLLLAKQSQKVKVIGTPTQGVLDYANAYISKYSFNGLPLIIPTYRSLRLPDYPIDNIGIQPDIYLDKTVHNWIQFAIEYLQD
jgi:hypothetical protein